MEVVAAAAAAAADETADGVAADGEATPVVAGQTSLQEPTPSTIKASGHSGPKSPMPEGASKLDLGSPPPAPAQTKLSTLWASQPKTASSITSAVCAQTHDAPVSTHPHPSTREKLTR